MSDGLLEFGDLFSFQEKEYIFLGSKTDVIYAAKILDNRNSILLSNYCSKEIIKNKKIDKPLYCFITLTTKEVKDRLAHFGRPENDPQISFKKLLITLNNNDLINLKKEIENSRAAPLGLREIVEKNEIRKE